MASSKATSFQRELNAIVKCIMTWVLLSQKCNSFGTMRFSFCWSGVRLLVCCVAVCFVCEGLLRPFKGLIRLLKSLIRPFNGLIRLRGLIRLSKGPYKTLKGPYKALSGTY